MIDYSIIFAPEAMEQIEAIRSYIALQASPETADEYVRRILDHCDTLSSFPRRGRPRDDLLHGTRSISFEGRATTVYRVSKRTVEVLAVAYGGRDLSRLLR